MNTVKCRDCSHYDVIRSGQTKDPRHGWCSVRSVYPFKEELGQIFPPNVQRVSASNLPAKPEIVEGSGVVSNCSRVSPK